MAYKLNARHYILVSGEDDKPSVIPTGEKHREKTIKTSGESLMTSSASSKNYFI